MPESGRLTNCIWKTHQYCIKTLESNVSLAARSKHVTHYATKYSKIRIIFHSNEHILKIHKDKSTVYTLHRYIPRYLINYISFLCHLLQHFLLSNNTGYQGDHSPDNVKFPDGSCTWHVKCYSYHARTTTKYLYGCKYAVYNKQF